MPMLGAPWGLLALLAAVPLVALYFLRRRQPPRVVSALFLWRTPAERSAAGPRFERLSRERALALELVAVLAASLFLADVHCDAARTNRALVVVVDGSWSLQAVSAHGSAEGRLKREVAELVREGSVDSVTLVESGPRPSVLSSSGPPHKALDVLAAWHPLQPSHDLGPALLLARQVAEPGVPVVLFTDGPLAGVPAEAEVLQHVQVRSVGEPAGNVAVVSAQRRDEGTTATVTVRVANFSTAPVTTPVTMTSPALAAPRVVSVVLGPGESTVVRAQLPADAAISVDLPDDALDLDNHATLLPVARAPVAFELGAGLDDATVGALRRFVATAGTTVGLGPSTAATSVVRIVPVSASAPSLGVTVVALGTQGPTRALVGPFFTLHSHPVLEDVRFDGVLWSAGATPPVGRVLVSAGDLVLLSEDEAGVIHLNVDLAHSNLQKTEAWPVLLGNVVRLSRERAPGLPRKHVALGEDVPVVTASGPSWGLRHADGTERRVSGVGALTVPALPKPGRWGLWRDGAEVDALEVLALDPNESDVTSRGPLPAVAGALVWSPTPASSHPRLWWAVALMLAMVLADFVLASARPVTASAPGRPT